MLVFFLHIHVRLQLLDPGREGNLMDCRRSISLKHLKDSYPPLFLVFYNFPLISHS